MVRGWAVLAPDEMKGLYFQLQEEQLPGPLAALGVLSGLPGWDQQLLPAVDKQDT